MRKTSFKLRFVLKPAARSTCRCGFVCDQEFRSGLAGRLWLETCRRLSAEFVSSEGSTGTGGHSMACESELAVGGRPQFLST